jgi:hypothetical protein
MIKAEDGKIIIEGRRDKVLMEVTTILHALKELVSEEEYKAVIRLADKSKEQLSYEIEEMREELKKLLGL